MELWIRSQDKECLVKVSNIQYDYDLHIVGTYYDNLKVLGKYKSKERALEVLDEIQNALELDEAFNYTGKVVVTATQSIIYNMPEE